MEIPFHKLVEGFYKDKYSGDKSFKEIKEICTYPFQYTKEVMSGDEAKDVRLKYIGKFMLKPTLVKNRLKTLDKRLEDNDITLCEYISKSKKLKDYVKG